MMLFIVKVLRIESNVSPHQ